MPFRSGLRRSFLELEVREGAPRIHGGQRAGPHQPRALKGRDEWPVRLVRGDAKLVLPPAIPSEDRPALRQIPQRLPRIEDENLLGEVFSRA